MNCCVETIKGALHMINNEAGAIDCLGRNNSTSYSMRHQIPNPSVQFMAQIPIPCYVLDLSKRRLCLDSTETCQQLPSNFNATLEWMVEPEKVLGICPAPAGHSTGGEVIFQNLRHPGNLWHQLTNSFQHSAMRTR